MDGSGPWGAEIGGRGMFDATEVAGLDVIE